MPQGVWGIGGLIATLILTIVLFPRVFLTINGLWVLIVGIIAVMNSL